MPAVQRPAEVVWMTDQDTKHGGGALQSTGDRVYQTRVVLNGFGSDEGRNIFADPDEAKTWLEGYVAIRYGAEPGEWREERSADEKWSMYPAGLDGRAVVMARPVRKDAEELLATLEETMAEIRAAKA